MTLHELNTGGTRLVRGIVAQGVEVDLRYECVESHIQVVFSIAIRSSGVGDRQDEVTWAGTLQSVCINCEGYLVHALGIIAPGVARIEIFGQHFGKIGDCVNKSGEESLYDVVSEQPHIGA